MSTLLRSAAFSMVLIFSQCLFASSEFSSAEACARLLSALEKFKPTPLTFDPPAKKGSAEETFLNFYAEEIYPVEEKIRKLILEYRIYNQLVDAGFYNSEEQRKEWDETKNKALNTYLEYTTSPVWEKTQIRFGDLAEGLSGELAKVARTNKEALKFTQFDEKYLPLLKEQRDLDDKIDRNANESPKKMIFQQNSSKQSQLLADYFDGKLSFEKASEEFESLIVEGRLSYGRDVFESSKTELNRIAEIKSELALSKGFATHAELSLASQSVSHTPEFQSKEKLLKFLYEILDSTQGVHDRYLQIMAKRNGIDDLSKLRPFQTTLLGFPTYLLMRDYFQKEKFTEIWRTTMEQSGFPSHILNQIIVDGMPREKKNSHAYMNPVQTPFPMNLTIDGQTLNTGELNEWKPSLIYILQNYDDDGIGDLETAFHEGGHALDFSYQHDPLGYSSAYGYTETHSTTMESFIKDLEFLLANGVTRSGEKLTRERAELFINRATISELLSLRGNVENAIYDILLWDYDYKNGDQLFTDRALSLTREFREKYSAIPWPKDFEGFEPGHSNFVTGHFRSGSVRYFGYVLAEVSASLMSEALLDRLEKETGRRSLYNQPMIAKWLGEQIYEDGFKVPFPESVEGFAGREFSPSSFTESLNRRVSLFLDQLEAEQK